MFRVLLQTTADFRHFAPAERDCGKVNGEYPVVGSSIGAEYEGIEFCPAAISVSHTQADPRSTSYSGCCVYSHVRKDTLVHNIFFLLLLIKGESEPSALFPNPAAFIETSRLWLESATGAEGS